MAKRRRRYYDTYEALKSHQHVTNRKSSTVTDWEIRDLYLDDEGHKLNRRQRGRIGHIERRKKR